MIDVRLKGVLRRQWDLVAAWQLVALGWTLGLVESRSRSWQRIHDGVYACQHGPLTRRQQWLATTLTAPGTLLGGHSAGACWGFRPWRSAVEAVVRPGSGGPVMIDGLYVRRSTTLAEEIDWFGPIPITSPERTLIDLAPHLDDEQLGKATREAIRLKRITVPSLYAALDRNRGRRGTRALWERAKLYENLPLSRTRSDAEGMALERFARAGQPIPEVNVKVGDYEADLVDRASGRIIEIDGPQFHLFPDEDAKREAEWASEGFRTIRRPSDAVYG